MHTDRLWDGSRWALVVLAALAHLAFAALDTRLPADGALVVHDLGPWLLAFENGTLPPELLRESGAWYTAGMAAALHLSDRAPAALRLYCASFGLLLLIQTGRLGRLLHGPAGGALATGLLLSMPLVTGLARIPWFHIPEAALVVTAALALQRDPQLQRWTSWAVLVPSGLLVASLRTTGPFWLLSLAPLLWPALSARNWRVLLLPLLWLPGAWIQLLVVAEYLSGKLAQRERYAEAVPGIWAQLDLAVGRVPLLLAAAGIMVGGPWRARRPELLLLVLWLGLPLLLVGVFRAGVDNHPLICVGLALLGASATNRSHWAAAVPVGWAVLYWGLMWGLPEGLRARVPLWRAESPRMTLQVPWTGFGQAEIEEILRLACTGPERCDLWVSGGLSHGADHSTGSLEGLLLGRPLRIQANLPPPHRPGAWVWRHGPSEVNPLPPVQRKLMHPVAEFSDGDQVVEVWAR